MTGEEAIAYLESVPWQGTRLGLSRTAELLEKLGSPERTLRFVHIAGTNGKGSTAAMTASVLRAAGYVTGLYISPFLEVFHERMSVNGERIGNDELGRLTGRVRLAAETMDDPPTEFELMTAIAFLYFQRHHCDIVVLEVGMGGRLDSTNVIPPPEAAVICNIGLDHVKELGDTLEKIAFEKAGIIKDGCDVVLYEPEHAGVGQVVEDVCRRHNAALRQADFSRIECLSDSIHGQQLRYKDSPVVTLHLLGEHQRKNAAVVLETISVLRSRGFTIPDSAVTAGFDAARWPGRFEVLRTDPVLIADGGHNRQCVSSVAAALTHYFPGRRFLFILGVLADKDYDSMLEILAPLGKRFFTLTPDSPRAMGAEDLAARLRSLGKDADACQSAADAVAKALRCAGKDDVICSVGSLYMTGAVRSAVLSQDG